jgi:hypothetical protein
MKPTEKMIYAFAGEPEITRTDAHAIEVGLTAALKDVPDVVPFAFPGYPDRPVYLHPCGTVAEVGVEDENTAAHIRRGECDCEGGQPWMRIYVERSEQR